MLYLPSEQKEMQEQILRSLEEEGRAYLNEPCNCGSEIRHNNGGNYHECIEFAKDGNGYFAKFATTCEFDPPAEWEETTLDKIKSIVSDPLSSW